MCHDFLDILPPLADTDLMSDYRVYKRKEGKRVAWYYEYADPDTGKRVRKSTKCATKREAQEFVDTLPPLKKKEAEPTKRVFTVREIAGDMYLPGSLHMLKRYDTGRELKPQTASALRGYLKHYIIEPFGDRDIESITLDEIQTSISLATRISDGDKPDTEKRRVSMSVKNMIADAWRELFSDAAKKIKGFVPPQVTRYKRRSRRYDTLSIPELKILFPADTGSLAKKWARPYDDKDRYGLMFGVMFELSVSTGMRSGEVRALQRDQLLPQYRAIMVIRAYNSADVLDRPKKGTEEDPRHRVVVVPARVWAHLTHYLQTYAPQEGPVFVYARYADHRPERVRKTLFVDRFRACLSDAEIPMENRRLAVHSLRYTYDTMMKRRLPQNVLMDIMGHRDQQMLERYSNPQLEQAAKEISVYSASIESMWEDQS